MTIMINPHTKVCIEPDDSGSYHYVTEPVHNDKQYAINKVKFTSPIGYGFEPNKEPEYATAQEAYDALLEQWYAFTNGNEATQNLIRKEVWVTRLATLVKNDDGSHGPERKFLGFIGEARFVFGRSRRTR